LGGREFGREFVAAAIAEALVLGGVDLRDLLPGMARCSEDGRLVY
jgi:hypothetical protein